MMYICWLLRTMVIIVDYLLIVVFDRMIYGRVFGHEM